MNLKTFSKKMYYRTRDTFSPRETINFSNSSVTFPSYFVENFSWTIETEEPVIEDLLNSVRDGDSFYDIGANAGLYSIAVGRAADVEITAFEPYTPNIDRLGRYLRWNDVEAQIYPYALSDGEEDTANLAGEMVHIETKIGDELVQADGIPHPDVIKIDVEGAELSVLHGLEEVIKDCRLIYCEVHPGLLEKRNIEPEQVTEFLRSLGFTTEELVTRERTNIQPIVRARRSE